MPRLTILGTSQVGALKEGWDAIAAAHPDWQVTFFAATAPRFRSLRLTGNLKFGLPATLAADTKNEITRAVLRINGATSTDLRAADVVLRAGFRHPYNSLAVYLESHDVEGLSVGGTLPVVSRAEFDAACDEIAEKALPPTAWRDWKRRRLILQTCPVPTETLLMDGRPEFRPWVAFAARPAGQRALLEAFSDRYEAILRRHGIGLLRQPTQTWLDNGLTAAAYGKGSRRLGRTAEHPDSDHGHMNADYGRLVLTALFETYRPATAPRHKRRVPQPKREAASPYTGLPARAYWRTGVAERAPLDPGDLFQPRFPVTRDMRIATAGSCFAQHVGRALRGAGFNVLDAETAPAHIPASEAATHGYGIYSGRYGNLYTARQLRQLFDEAEGRTSPALPVWKKGDRFFDAQRPGVDPDGLATAEETLERRKSHLTAVRGLAREADLFVFTFGLTEAWVHRDSGTVYPTAPGTIAGAFDPEIFAFRNFDAIETLADFEAFRAAMKATNPGMRFLVTVSPVPLTATGTGEHVEVATCYSKAVLRAACGMLVARHDDVDYFPSFEIITSQNARGAYYEPNGRNVSSMGVETAMRVFLRAHSADARQTAQPHTAPSTPMAARAGADPCEDALLDAFAH